jgi:F-type H+-transporting ATPase subunit b
MISIDYTLLIQILGFFILLVVLNQFLYKPVQRILREREEKIEGSIKKAAQTDKEIADGIISYEKKLKEAAVKGNEERARIRQEGIEKEKATIEAARAEAFKELTGIRNEIAASKKSAIAGLGTEAKTLARDIAGKVLERSVVGFLILGILVPSLAFASSEGGHGDSGMTWKIINFVILAVGVYLVWTKAISGLLTRRGSEIKTAIEEAQKAKEAADRNAAEYRAKISILDSKVAEIHNELKLEGEAEKARIIAESAKSAEALKAQAKIAAEQEIKKARIEIREEAARLAVQLAEDILKKELSPADQERLVKGYLNNLRLN